MKEIFPLQYMNKNTQEHGFVQGKFVSSMKGYIGLFIVWKYTFNMWLLKITSLERGIKIQPVIAKFNH